MDGQYMTKLMDTFCGYANARKTFNFTISNVNKTKIKELQVSKLSRRQNSIKSSGQPAALKCRIMSTFLGLTWSASSG
jgi:hypothetical protein